MDYEQLKAFMNRMSDDHLKQDVTVFVGGEYYAVAKLTEAAETDVLDKGHLFLECLSDPPESDKVDYQCPKCKYQFRGINAMDYRLATGRTIKCPKCGEVLCVLHKEMAFGKQATDHKHNISVKSWDNDESKGPDREFDVPTGGAARIILSRKDKKSIDIDFDGVYIIIDGKYFSLPGLVKAVQQIGSHKTVEAKP